MNESRPARPRSNLLPWAVAAVAVVALGANLYLTRDSDVDDPGMQPGEDAVAAPPAGAGAGSASASLPRSSQRGLSSTTAGGADRVAELLERRGVKTPAQRQADREALRRQLEGQFAADPADAVGGPRRELQLAETVVGDDMAATGLAPSDIDVDCRQSLCRVVATFDNSGDAQDWAMLYLTSTGGAIGNAQILQNVRPDGTVEVAIYGTQGDKAAR